MVRKFLLILLVMLVPLQSSSAAAAAVCLAQDWNSPASVSVVSRPSSAGDARAAHGGSTHQASALQGGHDPLTPAEHSGHGVQAHEALGHSLADACDDDCSPIAHHACCHAPAVALPVAVSDLQPPSGAADIAASPARPPRPRFSDGLFRPPRTVTA